MIQLDTQYHMLPMNHIRFTCVLSSAAAAAMTTAVLAYFVAALSPNMDVANAALPTYVTSLLFFGGFLFTFDKMPVWWKWYSYIDVIR